MRIPILFIAAFAVVVVSCSSTTDAASPAAEASSTTATQAAVGPLLPGRELTLSGVTSQQMRFVEASDGTAVLFEGVGDVSLTFDTGGGPTSGTFTASLGGEDDAGKSYVVVYEGILTGTYDPKTGSFDGTVVITGDAPPGFESAIPDEAIWDGGIVVGPDGCAESGVECAFGATQPNVDVYWEMPLPADAIDPAYLESIE